MRATKKNCVDVRNDQLADAVKDTDTHVLVLHPTKGYRRASLKRLMAAEGQVGMYRVFMETIQKAQKYAAKVSKQGG